MNESGFDFHCPLCGKELVEIKRPEPPEVDWDASQEEIDKALALNQAFDDDQSIDFSCPSGCFHDDFPLKAHHPIYGLSAAPGDSWSLSWVK